MNLPLSQSIELTDGEFQRISRLVYDQCGINLSDGKKELVKARLGKRIRTGGFRSFKEYYQYILSDESGQELIHLLDSIATNYTFFFREQNHFDCLRLEILPELIGKKKNDRRQFRFWSAACSSGEELYSIAITLLEAIENPFVWDISVLGTDISTKVLKVAKSGVFPKERIQSIPASFVKKYFLRGENEWKDYVKLKDEVKRLVQLRRLNLMESFSFSEPFDCIFCRNVMIYFDKKTQANLVNRLYECLREGGFLLIGHSESLTGIEHPFRYVKPSIYKK
ncbi:MAG: protein-glutamate O-methyltransferase CheR [Deltaproteobacteria bacterium]|nr:protein-glutamate O-methyltransferase CheR [Deltaproteobacteria bacterium]